MDGQGQVQARHVSPFGDGAHHLCSLVVGPNALLIIPRHTLSSSLFLQLSHLLTNISITNLSSGEKLKKMDHDRYIQEYNTYNNNMLGSSKRDKGKQRS